MESLGKLGKTLCKSNEWLYAAATRRRPVINGA
jgi:hypothetical protein